MKRVVPLALLVALAALSGAHAAEGSFGVTPVQLAFVEPPLLRGGVATGAITVHNSFDEPTRVTLAPGGDLAAWIEPETTAFDMEPGASRRIEVRVSVPDDAPNGEHAGFLRVRAQGADRPDGSGAALAVELLPAIRVRVTGDQVVALVAEGVAMDDRAPGAPLVVRLDVFNRGNVRSTPELDLVVVDAGGAERLAETLRAAPLEPGAKATLALATEGSLPQGAYVGRIVLRGSDAVFDNLAFDVVRGGAIDLPAEAPRGELLSLQPDAPPVAQRPVALVATFRNDGAPLASAKLAVEVLRDGARETIASGDALRVATGESARLDAWWTPARAGTYTLRGVVTYDGVRSEPLETSVIVADGAAPATAPAAAAPTSDAATTDAATGADAAPAQAATPGVGLVALVGAAVVVALARRR